MAKTKKKRGIIARQAARELQNIRRRGETIRAEHWARLAQGEGRATLTDLRIMARARAFAPLRARLEGVLTNPCREGKQHATRAKRPKRETVPLLRTPEQVTAYVAARLRDFQGRRRERTLRPDQVLHVIREAVTDGLGFTGGGTVAKSYGYPAEQTIAHAKRLRSGAIELSIDTCSAYTPGTTKGARDVIILGAAARSLVARHLRATRVQRHAALCAALAGVEPDLIVTRADSLQAGNCATWTDRAAKALGESAKARAVILWACKHGVLTFAQRAIAQARRRTAQPTEAAR